MGVCQSNPRLFSKSCSQIRGGPILALGLSPQGLHDTVTVPQFQNVPSYDSSSLLLQISYGGCKFFMGNSISLTIWTHTKFYFIFICGQDFLPAFFLVLILSWGFSIFLLNIDIVQSNNYKKNLWFYDFLYNIINQISNY